MDFIEYNEDSAQLIKDSLKPAKVDKVEINAKKATVSLPADQKALAI
ncbi:MAG: hypothetical protein ACOZBL_01830 [Patescibacteria group bacterium]